MKVLLDENLPKPLLRHITGDHEITTVAQAGWAGKRNGELLQLMLAQEYDVLITADRNLEYQQNIAASGLRLIVLSASNIKAETLIPLMLLVSDVLAGELAIGSVIHVSLPAMSSSDSEQASESQKADQSE